MPIDNVEFMQKIKWQFIKDQRLPDTIPPPDAEGYITQRVTIDRCGQVKIVYESIVQRETAPK